MGIWLLDSALIDVNPASPPALFPSLPSPSGSPRPAILTALLIGSWEHPWNAAHTLTLPPAGIWAGSVLRAQGCLHTEELRSLALISVPAQCGWQVEPWPVDWPVGITQPVRRRPKARYRRKRENYKGALYSYYPL